MGQYGITILGTGGDSVVMGRQMRATGGLVITTPQNQVHIDPGPGALIQLAKQGFHPRETTAILLSHQHIAHASEAAAIITAMTHNGMDKRGLLITNTLEECIIPHYHRKLTEKTLIIHPGSRIGVNDIEIRAVQTKHYDSNALGYLVRTPYYVLGYTGDTAYADAWAKEFVGSNILVCNCKYPGDDSEGDHLSVADVIKLVKVVKPQLAVITHFGTKMLDSDPLAQARRIHQETNVQVVAAKDGLHIAPSHYDVKQNQKTLGNF